MYTERISENAAVSVFVVVERCVEPITALNYVQQCAATVIPQNHYRLPA